MQREQARYENVVRTECTSTVTCQIPRAAWVEWAPRPLRQLRSSRSIGWPRTWRRDARISKKTSAIEASLVRPWEDRLPPLGSVGVHIL